MLLRDYAGVLRLNEKRHKEKERSQSVSERESLAQSA